MKLDTIGRNLRACRLAKHLRQEDIAEQAGLTANYIGMVERGEKIPSLETFLRLLNALGASADAILADVLDAGYIVKDSMAKEQLEKRSPEDRELIAAVVETLLRHTRPISPK